MDLSLRKPAENSPLRAMFCLFAFAVTTACSDGRHQVAASGSLCGNTGVSSLQMMTSALNAGLRTRAAFRLSKSGTLSQAIWTDDNELLAVSDSIIVEPQVWTSALKLIDGLQEQKPPSGQTTDTGAPIAGSLTYSLTGGDERAQFDHLDHVPPSISAQLRDWASRLQPRSPAPGDWLWSMPLPRGAAGTADWQFDTDSCEQGLANALDSAGRNAAIAVRSVPELAQMVPPSERMRARFTARSKFGEMWFGLLTTPPGEHPSPDG